MRMVNFTLRFSLGTLSLLFLLPKSFVSAQASNGFFVEAHLGKSPAKRMTLLPTAAKILFPSSKVFLQKKDVSFALPAANQDPLKELQFVIASDYLAKESAPSNVSQKDPSATTHAAAITAVVYKDTLYVVGELFYEENLALINKLLRETGVQARTQEEALQVAEFYLQLGHYSFEAPSSYLVFKFEQLPDKQVEFPGQNESEIRTAIHPPTVAGNENGYKTDIVAMDSDAAFVYLRRWRIGILDSQVVDPQQEVVVPSRDHYRAGEAPSDRFGGTLASPSTDLRFQLSVIADGMTPGSTSLNVSTYGFNTSEGPSVRRSSFSFKSAEEATSEFEKQLRAASQILEQGKWLDTDGKQIGKRALLLYASRKSNGVSIAVLLFRGSRVFEVSSLSLKNALEFEKVWFHSEPGHK
jgi:hypothetical protein